VAPAFAHCGTPLALLPRFAGDRQIAADQYGLGGEVAEFEAWFASRSASNGSPAARTSSM
jgi:hypothetical protein